MLKFFRVLPLLCAPFACAEDSAWVSLINGKNLDGWTSYFSSRKLAQPLINPDSTFGVTPEGWLNVNIHLKYDSTKVGHLFYTQRKLSYYMVRAVYRFTSDVLGPGWTGADNIQNNGFMIHCPAPSAMNYADFPTSVEVQLVGPKNTFFNRDLVSQGWKYATSMNLCLPGVTVNLNGSDLSSNCHHANYPAAWKNTEIPWEDKDGWSDATARVLGDSLIQHFIHGVKVHEYSRIRKGGQPLKEGYLAIQAEGSSTQFKTMQLLDLVGCMDKTSPAYRTYFVKHDAAACAGTVIGEQARAKNLWVRRGSTWLPEEAGESILAVHQADGKPVAIEKGAHAFAPIQPGVYWVTIQAPKGRRVAKVIGL